MKPEPVPPAGADGSELIGEHVRIYRRGKMWYANYQHERKQLRVSLQTSSKKAALRRALKIDTELATGQFKAAAKVATVDSTIAAYREYLLAEDRAPKTLVKYEKLFERVSALACARKVRDMAGIDMAFMDAFRKQRLDDGAAPKTRYNEATILRQLVNFALSRKMIQSDPISSLKLKKPPPTEQPCWTLAEVVQILAASPVEIRPALTLLAETGLRFGELAWLTWDDVDFENEQFHIRPKDDWRVKTGNRRTVPMSEPARSVLNALPRTARWVVTMPATTTSPKRGQQWTERRLLTALKVVLKSLGLKGKLHTFRHFFISNALLKGTATLYVREWVGHVDRRILDLYSHVDREAGRAAMQRLSVQNNLHKPEQKDGSDAAQI